MLFELLEQNIYFCIYMVFMRLCWFKLQSLKEVRHHPSVQTDKLAGTAHHMIPSQWDSGSPAGKMINQGKRSTCNLKIDHI